MKIFNLPDLGEGLTDAEVVEWYVKPGDEVTIDTPLVSVETAKAVVDIPSPRSGQITRLFGEVGDIIETGKPLVEFEEEEPSDTGTVVGKVETSDEKLEEKAVVIDRKKSARVKATPAVRALARRLDVDLSIVSPSGRDGTVTVADVERVAKRLKDLGPPELLRSARRTMAVTMGRAQAEVAPATIMDDADIDHWPKDFDVTVRLARAMSVACKAEPSLNAWYDGHSMGRRVLEKIDIAIAVDTPDGLFVPVLRDVANRNDDDLRSGIDCLKIDVRARTIPPDEMRAYTITLSNYGTIAGRYAVPVVVPPTVAIVGAGRIENRVIPVDTEIEIHRILPLTLTFDHRAVTGGEAGRFLMTMISDLEGFER